VLAYFRLRAFIAFAAFFCASGGSFVHAGQSAYALNIDQPRASKTLHAVSGESTATHSDDFKQPPHMTPKPRRSL